MDQAKTLLLTLFVVSEILKMVFKVDDKNVYNDIESWQKQ